MRMARVNPDVSDKPDLRILPRGASGHDFHQFVGGHGLRFTVRHHGCEAVWFYCVMGILTVTPGRSPLSSFRAGRGLECARPPQNTNTRGLCMRGQGSGSSAGCTIVEENTVGAPLVTGSSAAEEVELIQIGA